MAKDKLQHRSTKRQSFRLQLMGDTARHLRSFWADYLQGASYMLPSVAKTLRQAILHRCQSQRNWNHNDGKDWSIFCRRFLS